jgi:hypothetical protein
MRQPVSLAAMRDRRKRLTVETAYGPITLTYRPGSITPNRIKRFRAATDDQDVVTETIAALIAEWDVTEFSGGPAIATTDPLVGEMDINALSSLIAAVIEDMQPGETTGVGSFSG